MEMDKIIIRPSSLETLVACPRQWYHTFMLGVKTIPSVRAGIGTSIHAGAEVMWADAIVHQKKDINTDVMVQAAVETYEDIQDIKYDVLDVANKDQAHNYIKNGVIAFAGDIATQVDIPLAVEELLEIKIDHPVVSGIRGTVDYINSDTIADIKTSKRKITPSNHKLQQTMYRYLASKNGYDIKHNEIHGVVLAKTKTYGEISKLEANVQQIKFIVNNLLDRLRMAKEDKIDPDILFPGNPKHYLCSDMYCNLRSTCPFVRGEPVTLV